MLVSEYYEWEDTAINLHVAFIKCQEIFSVVSAMPINIKQSIFFLAPFGLQ